MWHRENDKLVNAMWMGRCREPRHGGSPVVANDVRCVDTERVKNADHIANRVLQGIRAYSFGAIGASEATQVRRDRVEAVIDEEWDLVAPEICRIRPPMEQEHRLTAAVVFHMNRVSATSMIRSTIPGRAIISCGSDRNSVEARKRSASYVVATRSALTMRARRVCRLRFRPTLDQRVEPGDPRPIDLDRVAVPGRHSHLGHGVLCEREREWVVQVLSYRAASGFARCDSNPRAASGATVPSTA